MGSVWISGPLFQLVLGASESMSVTVSILRTSVGTRITCDWWSFAFSCCRQGFLNQAQESNLVSRHAFRNPCYGALSIFRELVATVLVLGEGMTQRAPTRL